MKTLTLLPQNGLCNRMRAIVSAKLVTEQTNHRLRVLWVKYPGLSARYDELFEKDDSCDYVEINNMSPNLLQKVHNALRIGHRNSILSKIHASRFDSLHCRLATNELKEGDVSGFKHANKIFISSCCSFFKNKAGDLSYFTPIAQINNKITDLSKNFTSSTIGVHVRRTDHDKAISASPTSAFTKIMSDHLRKEPSADFFVATDSMAVKQELSERFPGKIISRPIQPDRSSLEGMRDAVIDLYLLSKCAMVYGSYWSSFSKTAADVGNIRQITVMGNSDL